MAMRSEYVAFVTGTSEQVAALRLLVAGRSDMAHVDVLAGVDVYVVRPGALHAFVECVLHCGCELLPSASVLGLSDD